MHPKKKNRLFKVSIWVSAILLFNILLLIILLHIPAIQTKLAQSVSRRLSSQTGFEISVSKVDIRWIDRFTLFGLNITDEDGIGLLKLDELNINYKLGTILQEAIRLDHAKISGLDMNLGLLNSDTLNITVLINRLKRLRGNEKPGSTYFTIDELRLEASNFYYQITKDRLGPHRFNPRNFSLLEIEADLNNLIVKQDTFMLGIQNLSTYEGKTKTRIEGLQAKYEVSSRHMKFDSLSAGFGKSTVHGNMEFSYAGYGDLSRFIEKVRIEAHLKSVNILSEELSLFSGYFDRIDDHYKVTGDFKGEIDDFSIKNLVLHFGKGSQLIGTTYFSGLPNLDETFIDLGLKNSSLAEGDLEQYISSKAFTDYNRFSSVLMNGAFTGYLEDFVASGSFETNLGTIITDINLKKPSEPANTTYSGKLKLIDFDLGEYNKTSQLGLISLDGEIKGKGFTLGTAKFEFNGKIDQLDANNYKYTGIETEGKFEKEYFSGLLIIDDPNLKLNTQNEIDLRNNGQRINIIGELEYANLEVLNIFKYVPVIKSKINANINGFEIDKIRGHIYLEDLYAENQNQQLVIDHLTLNSDYVDEQRTFEVISDRLNLKAWGNFNYTNAYNDVRYMLNEFWLNLMNNPDSLQQFYVSNPKEANEKAYEINLKSSFKNIDRFIKLFEPNLKLHSATSIEGKFRKGDANSLTLFIENDSISYKNNILTGNQLNLDASKVIGQPIILASADIQSANQYLSGGGLMNDLIISAVWSNRKIDFNWYNTNQQLKNINDLYGEITFHRDSTQVHLNRSQLKFLDEGWTIQDNNLITIDNKKIRIKDFNIGSDDQMITATGVIGDAMEDILAITANNLDMATFNPLLRKEISGRLSGEFALSNLYNTPTIVSNFYINSFFIEKFLIGDIFSSNDWNNERNLFDIQFIVSRENSPVILVNGIFNPFDKKNALDLDASFMNARVDMAEPFIETIFSNMKGNINGKVHIIGSLDSPVISGNGSFADAGLKVNYLNTNYDVTGNWMFDSTAIYLQNLVLTDINNNTGYLDGKFNHQHFKNFTIDLHGRMEKFLVLNTTAKDNDLFYGSGIATGTVDFIGPIEDITIRAQATSQRGTRVFIPIGGGSSTEFEDYISFVDFEDTLTNNLAQEEDVKITGLNLELDLDITEEAYTEIIFDITSGDIIRGRGNGNIGMKIDTKGEFSMIGNYEFVSGGYNFTMYNIVNKEFDIEPKSRITWTGDPYGGMMDIDASYRITTSLAPLVDTVYHNSMSDLKRKYPAEVLLGLRGPLLTPDIDFQIIIDEYPKSNVDLDTQIKGFLNTVAVDQQELNRQVFSLLILRKFSPPNSFSSSGTIGSSVSEFVSNQLSYWISQVDENLTIDMEVDLSSFDEEALKTFQLRISYEFMDGKLIVTRDGGFTDPNNQASAESIAGDWTLEYLLSEDGRLRIKLFNKTNYNQFNSSTGSDSQPLVSGGFSLIYTTSFDSFSDLFKRKKKKREEKEKEDGVSSTGLKPDEKQGIESN